jgi:2-keto-4-pentenoate hydratase/2-oxohepta-3-ene-1,7-dioic acid hydratase in catechol pathway
MRLVTFRGVDGKLRAGAFVNADRQVVDLALAHQSLFHEQSPHLTSVLAIIEGGDAALDLARDVIKRAPADALLDRAKVHVRAPLQPPPQMRDCLCFEKHLRQSYAAGRRLQVRKEPDPEAAFRAMDTSIEDKVLETFQRQPIYYKANRFSTVGIDDEVIWPSYSRAMDFELEWGCFIGKHAKDVPAASAKDYIFGYTIFNDFSARDAQALEMSGQLGPAKGKDFDTGNVLGPCLVTVDEISDPYNLEMAVRVNGEEWGRGSTASMRWTFEDVIAHISRSETLHPGEFLGSGTVGDGCGLEHMRYLKAGDIIELEVEKIGILRNHLIKQ